MKYNLVLFLPLFIGGCVNTSPHQEASGPPANAESCPQSEFAGEAPSLERYPPVALRSDLGESPVKCERELVLDAMTSVEEVIELRRTRDQTNFGRGDHAKALGCYEATFTLSAPDVVRADDQVGIAKHENLGRTFDAIVRLSNSEPKNVPDFRSATMGLAVKVMLEPAKYPKDDFLPDGRDVQDFVAGGLDTFVASGIADYAELFRLRIHQYSNALRIQNRHPEAFAVFGTEPLSRYFNLSSSAAPIVLEKKQRFSSLVPYAWGDSAVKFRFEPCHEFDRSTASFSRFDSRYQAKLVSEFLQSNDICYVMKIQKRPRPGSADEKSAIEKAFPVEDAMASWPEPGGTKSALSAEFREVARVKIKARSTAIDDRECEELAFNPWNGLKAHQPLGSLNRARWAVYRTSECVRKEIYPPMPEEQK
jgi:hypothetical protein